MSAGPAGRASGVSTRCYARVARLFRSVCTAWPASIELVLCDPFSEHRLKGCVRIIQTKFLPACPCFPDTMMVENSYKPRLAPDYLIIPRASIIVHGVGSRAIARIQEASMWRTFKGKPIKKILSTLILSRLIRFSKMGTSFPPLKQYLCVK